MRLFVAAELPYEMAEAMGETIANLRDCVRGRFVASANLHLTLAFLGEVDAFRVDDAAAAMQRACEGRGPIEAELGELGAFGSGRRVVLWQGVESGGSLEGLASELRDELDRAGLSYDAKPFLPHVTLMRNADLTRIVSLPTAAVAQGSIERITL